MFRCASLLLLVLIGAALGSHVNLRMLILTPSTNESTNPSLGFVTLAFDAVGMQYDIVVVSASSTLDLSTTAGVGKYSGIVSIQKEALSEAQQLKVIEYQKQYGVKWAVIGSSPSDLPGVKAGTATNSKGTLTLASEFYPYAHPLKHTISIDTAHSIAWAGLEPATITPATITDPTIATPAMCYNGNQVAVAALKLADGTHQLHYFIDQGASYFHSRVFSVLLVNWLSPAGLFIGRRMITLAVQPDDFFLSSYLWDPKTHSNPNSESHVYRLSPLDLQNASDFLTAINPTLPVGSHVTIEWPFNGAGTTWYQQPDPLFAKAVELQNNFYFVSHTWDHPCTFDTATYAEVSVELSNNAIFTPSFLAQGLSDPTFTKEALVNPCITGLFNGECLRAMADNGIKYAVGDNSVESLVPENLYHGITTTVEKHGYAGIFIIPREAYDIDYDNSLPEELVDQFNHENDVIYTFEEIMALSVDYAIEKKTGFRHDAFMFHQANVRFFDYKDPFSGKSRTVSLTTLWMERVIEQLVAIYDLPIVSPRFDKMAQIWMDREAVDKCGFNADLEISNGQLISVTATSTASCEVSLSGLEMRGAAVRMDHNGPEVTAYVTMTPNQPVQLTLAAPIPV